MVSTPLPPPTTGSGVLYNSPTTTTPTQTTSSSLPSLRAAPIAHFTSLPNDGIGNDGLKSKFTSNNSNNNEDDNDDGVLPTAGRLVAVNSNYIAYAVKKGLVRVIHRTSGAKTLLRGHNDCTRIVDAMFFGGTEGGNNEGVGGLYDELYGLYNAASNTATAAANTTASTSNVNSNKSPPLAASDVLATLGGCGNNKSSVLIWRLHSNSNNGENNVTLGADKLLEVQFTGGSGSSSLTNNKSTIIDANRIVWHPFNPNRFILLHRNYCNSNDKDNEECYNNSSRAVATLVETTKLVTCAHETEGHMVCDLTAHLNNTNNNGEENDDEDDTTSENKTFTSSPPGTTLFKLSLNDDNEHVSNLDMVGANDISWSNKHDKYVLTGHDDGYVRLWDLTGGSKSGGRGEEEEDGSTISCVSTINVVSSASSSSKRVTRVIFLSQYEDSLSSRKNHGDDGTAVTPPFITGTDMNHTITLWSSFSSSSSSNNGRTKICPPSRLRIFGLRNDIEENSMTFSTLSLMSVEICPAPYHPPTDGEDGTITVPSSFVLLAERTSGVMHALHIDTEWKKQKRESGGESTSSSLSSSTVVVKGFDYVSTMNVVHPVYSFCVAPSPPTSDDNMMLTSSGGNALKEERDVELCCIQSKAVQLLTLSADMCAPPPEEDVVSIERGNLSPGVTLLDLPPSEVSDDDISYNDDDEDGEFEDDYDMEEEGDDVEYSTNDSDDEDEENENVEEVMPAVTDDGSKPNAFANWLGAIAKPFSEPTAASAPQSSAPPARTMSPATSPPPPGLVLPSALPPPPGMAASTSSSLPASAPNNSMALLSPMQILSESGSDLEPSKKQGPTKTTNPTSLSKTAKKQPIKKKGQDGKKALPQVASSNQPTGPMKILQREEMKEESPSSGGTSNIDVSAIETIVQRAIAKQMKSHETQLLASLRKVISTEVRSSIKEADKATEQAVHRGIASGLSNGLGKALDNGKVGKKFETHAKESAALAAKEAVENMQPAIINALHQTMKEVMIPAYEAATSQMFQQTSTSLERGLAQMSVNHAKASVPTLETMSNQMMKMGEAIQSLSSELAQLRGDVNANRENGAATKGQPSPPQPPMGIRNEITALCQAQRYEDAFTKAVSASDGQIVLFACQQADSAVVFGNGEVSVSQPILICLLQQLGAVLVTATDVGDIKTILTWLQEIAVTIDPTNPNIQRHVGSVVQQLLVNINSKMSNCDPSQKRKLQTLMQVIRGIGAQSL